MLDVTMKKVLFITVCLFLIFETSFGQTSNEKVLFIVDSIAVAIDPEDGNELLQTDVADMTVIRSKDSLKFYGYDKYDAVLFLFTKEYRSRPDDIRKIPSSKQMEKKDGTFLFKGFPYSGPFIDYYYSGKKQGDGIFLNGKLSGDRKMYYQNGNVQMHSFYKNGLKNGLESEYYEDGTLRQKGELINGKMEGVWESFFINGKIKLQSKYKAGQLFETATKYYSTGRVKETAVIRNGEAFPDPAFAKISELMTKSYESDRSGNVKAAIKYCSKAIELDSGYAEAYFSRGTIKLNDFQFDQAIEDFDKALKFEPLMEVALSNRAFARIRKYQFASSRTLSKNSEVTVLASKDKVPIPQSEQEKICIDLERAVFLGDKSAMITEALVDYCSKK